MNFEKLPTYIAGSDQPDGTVHFKVKDIVSFWTPKGEEEYCKMRLQGSPASFYRVKCSELKAILEKKKE